MPRWTLVLVTVLAACKSTPEGMPNARVDGYTENMPLPRFDRCASQPEGKRAPCERIRDQAYVYARGLSVGDEVCLEGNAVFDGITRDCQVRGVVEDATTSAVKLKVRQAPSGSTYERLGSYWFAEENLVDMYLKAAGFSLRSEQPQEP